jgi:hypothetical protein
MGAKLDLSDAGRKLRLWKIEKRLVGKILALKKVSK